MAKNYAGMMSDKGSGYNRLLWEMSRSHLLLISAIIFLSVLGMLFEIVSPLIIGKLIDDVLIGKNTSLLIPILLVMACVYVVSAVSNYLSANINGNLNVLLFNNLSSRVFNKVQETEYKDLTRLKTGDLQFRTTTNVGSTIQIASTIIPQILVTIAGIFLPVIIMFSMNPEITLIVISPVFLFILSSWYFGERIKTVQRPVLDSNANLNSFLKETYSTIPLIKAFGLENWARERYDRHLSHYSDATIEAVKVSSMNSAVSMLIYSVPSILLFIFGSMAVIEGRMTIGILTAFLGYVGLFFSPVQQLSFFWRTYKGSQASYDRLDEILEFAPDNGGDKNLAVPDGDIRFEGVWHSYDDRVVLKDTAIHFKTGRNYLIGDNGSGKTTIAKLLCGLYTQDRGKILIDGQDISEVSRSSLRSSVSVVFADSLLFDGSIADNVLFGNLSATNEEMILAAKKADLHEFVMKLPSQYESRVGESGLNLSSGEKQKIALARVILRNSPIIIFDEFTRSIDIESKKSILSVIRQLDNKTIIIITHDMNDIEQDGRIVVLRHEGTTPSQDPLINSSVTNLQAVPWG
jgi:ABC-type bacteriocin/lantibiotic exporter with double-glycine peptidase domain